ncbi:Cell division protein ZipA [BD1-7 clade bacterium]|uniref:Cell division protein ZipA n=1 Tax=BD1-7 clade bacterium TaxID=2029982 RepID=A0A5S9Q8W1_9GAMM|nr:Cell division protein ZipA [BD1-7 clade bacterium]CAA0114442.1 Cell division protein ZipA [BD1-7 clade bacterium]
MELSIRDWLLIIGILLLMAVALDGIRRARQERRNQVRLSRNAKRAARKAEDEDPFNSELPNGGARVADNKNMSAEDLSPRPTLNTADDELSPEAVAASPENLGAGHADVVGDDIDPLFTDPFKVQRQPTERASSFSLSTKDGESDRVDASRTTDSHSDDLAMPTIKAQQVADVGVELDDNPYIESDPEDILVLHACAPKGKPFDGARLRKILDACDCRLARQHIYHRFERENGHGGVQFSIANMVEPGTFVDIDREDFSSPGVSFFLRLPGADDPTEAYNCMIEVAQALVRNLGGSLKDEAHSTATEQTLEHGRERIREFLKRKLLKSN